MRLRLIGDWLAYMVVRIAVCVVQAMTIEACHRMSRLLAVLAADVLRLRGDVVDENLRHAFPDWSPRRRQRVTRAMWEHLFLMGCEITQVPRKIHDTNWRRYVHVGDVRPLCRSLIDPRPTVVLLGHFGNFEVGGVMAGLLGFRTFTIARPLDNPFLDRFLTRFRSATGQYMLPKQGSAQQITELLEKGETLALLGDQNAGPKGCWVDFFNRPASCHKAIALFSMTSGAPMVVNYFRRVGGPMQFEMGYADILDPGLPDAKPVTVTDITQWYSRCLEQIIRADPEQYWWVHRRWKDTRTKRRRKAA